MVLKRFEICGKNTRVIHVALRLNLVTLASDYCLHIACQNKSKENKVLVVVQGEEQDITNFHKCVRAFDPQLFVEKKSYTVTKITEYSGIVPHWDQYWEEVNRENMLTGVRHLTSISSKIGDMNNDMSEIKGMFAEQQNRFHTIGQGIQAVKQDMDTLKETAKTLKSIDNKLESLVTISEFLKQLMDSKK